MSQVDAPLQKNPKPVLIYALRLNCPLCGNTRLQAPQKFFEFEAGCPQCQFLYEREDGYFSGAPWMVGYPLVGITLLVIGLFLKLMHPEISAYFLVGIGFTIGTLLSVLGYPWFRAIWMFADLWFHPLTAVDRQQFQHSVSQGHLPSD